MLMDALRGENTVNQDDALKALRGDDPTLAARAAETLWTMWHRSGTAKIDAMLYEGIVALQANRHAEAEALFTSIIAVAPDFAEAWNKRATVRYMAGDYEGSVADCIETLARNPNHFGALSGQGLCHIALGQFREAAALFRRALEVHPHLENARQNLRTALSELVKWN